MLGKNLVCKYTLFSDSPSSVPSPALTGHRGRGARGRGVQGRGGRGGSRGMGRGRGRGTMRVDLEGILSVPDSINKL